MSLPGITGLWQVQARQDPSFDSYVSLDVTYIENWSVWLDLKIIASHHRRGLLRNRLLTTRSNSSSSTRSLVIALLRSLRRLL